MLITVHRWQPKTNRFNNQKFTLEDAETFFGLLDGVFYFSHGAEVLEPGVGVLAVDRIEVNAHDGTVDIYTSPVVERNYERKTVGVDKEVALSPLRPVEPKQSLEQMFDDEAVCTCQGHCTKASHGVCLCTCHCP
jgi:hypothetical protein